MDLTYVIVGITVAVVVAAIFLFGGSRGDTKVVLGAAKGKSDEAANTGGFDDMMREAQALLGQGRKIEAIKLLNERSGTPLDKAKAFVEAIEKLGALGTATLTVTTNTTELSQQDTAEIQRLIRLGKKIEAIKLIRDRTGLGLKEAKDVADQHV
jgi:ribosomal protein L7/L12